MTESKPNKQELKKLKLLYLLQILQRETDDDHGLTTPQIIERLAAKGVEVERKTLYRDFECLRKAGYDVQKYAHRRPVEYALIPDRFPPEDLVLMADAVQSSKSITDQRAAAIVDRIGKLGSKYVAANLRKRIHVAGRVKREKPGVFYWIDAIQHALDDGRQVSFKYYKYNERKELVAQHGGRIYRETPVRLLYKSGLYYLISWRDAAEGGEDAAAVDGDAGGFRTYRIDRMRDVQETEEPATVNEAIKAFDINTYLQQTFDMYSGEPTDTLLRVKGTVMSAVIDRFGEDVRVVRTGDGTATVNVTVRPAPTFFGWLAQFGGDVVIEKPASLQQAYREHLKSIIDHYPAL